MFMIETVATDVDDGDKWYIDFDVGRRDGREQPWDDGAMRTREDELIYYYISIMKEMLDIYTCQLLYQAQRYGRLCGVRRREGYLSS